ncbi:DUF3783 domain-containing protein [Desulforhabdus amnigena]|uniref:DUF3783 domain-containing protein n=1 Tax=Desulforhabdus amnigena TaxID=40218 RepID=A0A9W6FTP1_9BACT|nr:DUF3783 domain-containing protein [Desulforhabdus amnigena]NLJ29318.1 DUF3783 domain-containing protein [Deltaproteobacteria bacterium]GLI34415.1 hypothetical protein DAMNIGENAA_18480 [Desulforhabdus amnigena]
MDKPPRLLMWNYSAKEQENLQSILKEVGAPHAVPIEKTQGTLTLKEIIHLEMQSDEEFASEEKVLLFYNIPPKGVHFLLNLFKTRDLPRPIYAVVTEHSINWPFSVLLEHLIEERNAMTARQASQEPA